MIVTCTYDSERNATHLEADGRTLLPNARPEEVLQDFSDFVTAHLKCRFANTRLVHLIKRQVEMMEYREKLVKQASDDGEPFTHG